MFQIILGEQTQWFLQSWIWSQDTGHFLWLLPGAGCFPQTQRQEPYVPKNQEIYIQESPVSWFSHEMMMPQAHQELDGLWFCFLINSSGKENSCLFSKTRDKYCKFSSAPDWQRRTFSEPCNSTCVGGCNSIFKLLYVLLSSGWDLDSILSETKESTVFFCGGETARGFVASLHSDVPSAMESQNNVLYGLAAKDTWRALTTAQWGWRLKLKNYSLEPKFHQPEATLLHYYMARGGRLSVIYEK